MPNHTTVNFSSCRFQRACTKYGLADVDLFQTTDLWDRKNIALVTQTIFAVGRSVSYKIFNSVILYTGCDSMFFFRSGLSTSRVERTLFGTTSSRRKPSRFHRRTIAIQRVNYWATGWHKSRCNAIRAKLWCV